MINSCNGHCLADQYVNMTNSPSADDTTRSNVYTSSASHCSSSENVQSGASSQQKAQAQDSRTNNSGRVGVPDLLSGATVVATSAINTARSVFNMFVPPRSTDVSITTLVFM